MIASNLAAPAHQSLDDADQIAAHGAADAAVVHLEYFLVGADDEIIVDADLAELVDNDGIAAAVLFGENAVQQRRLSGAEIAGDDGDGNFVGQCVSPRAPTLPSPARGRSWLRKAESDEGAVTWLKLPGDPHRSCSA